LPLQQHHARREREQHNRKRRGARRHGCARAPRPTGARQSGNQPAREAATGGETVRRHRQSRAATGCVASAVRSRPNVRADERWRQVFMHPRTIASGLARAAPPSAQHLNLRPRRTRSPTKRSRTATRQAILFLDRLFGPYRVLGAVRPQPEASAG
jgi:hypothetical protein